jgi:A/G-specific adenine glycosylase
MPRDEKINPSWIRKFRRALIAAGLRHGSCYPWHRVESAFHVLVAEFLLRRTTRKAVAGVFPTILRRFPDERQLARANSRQIWAVIRRTGLRHRAAELGRLGRVLTEQGGVRAQRNDLLSLPSVGPYIADAVLLYGFRQRWFPLDQNVQRVLMRTTFGRNPEKRLRPYDDAALAKVAQAITGRLDSADLTDVHQGILYIAWEFCRATPACRLCPISPLCRYSKAQAMAPAAPSYRHVGHPPPLTRP